MNGNYFSNPTFPSNDDNITTDDLPPSNINYTTTIPMEQSFIENILRLNKGKKVKAYFSYPDSNEWRDKVYNGIIEEAGRDHLVLSEPSTGDWLLLRMIYLNYIEFEEKINYQYPYTEI